MCSDGGGGEGGGVSSDCPIVTDPEDNPLGATHLPLVLDQYFCTTTVQDGPEVTMVDCLATHISDTSPYTGSYQARGLANLVARPTSGSVIVSASSCDMTDVMSSSRSGSGPQPNAH